MALIRAAALMLSAAIEAASLVWMELAMFAAAAALYALWAGGAPNSRLGKLLPSTKSAPRKPTCAGAACASGVEHELREHLAKGDHRAVLRLWHRAKALEEAPLLDLASVVDSMRKLGRSAPEVLAELRSALNSCPGLLPSFAALPAALLRDDAVELLDGTLALLEERDFNVEPTAYAGLMGAQLRRRDYAGVAATASRVPSHALSPKMRAMLASAAAQRSRLDEALGHLRQMPVPAEGARCALAPVAAAQILALAAREQRVPTASQELQRIHARLETKHLDELIVAESRRHGPMACMDLLDAGQALRVEKGPGAYQALAGAQAQTADGSGLCALVEDLEAEAKRGHSGVAVGEPLALALLEACKAVRNPDLAPRVVALHLAACAGAPGSRVYAAACGTLVACERFQEACDFYDREMAPKGVWPDAALTSSLLKAAAQAGQAALAQRLSDHAAALRTSVPGVTSGATNSDLQRHATMIKAYARERDLSGAASVFNRLRSSGAQLSPLIYNCFLDACVQCGDLEGALRHFEEMKELGFVDVVGYNTVLKAHLARGRTEEARALVKEMAAHGLQANKVTYNELLHAKVIAKDRKGTWNLIEEMHESGVRANSVTCSILLKSLTVHSHPADVKRIITLIDEVEDTIDEVLFSSVIEACIRIKHLDLLSDLMRRYRQKGGFVNLTAPTYGSMIKAYGQAGDVARVQELWAEMEERGVKPTSITLGCMAEALVTNNQAQEAWELIHRQLELEERRGCINTVIYSTVLKGFAVNRRIDKVFAVYKEMRAKGIPCNTITYNTMLDACAKCCAMDHASQLLEDMKESCVEPDIITYSTIVKGYCLEGDVDRAFHVLEEMKGDEKFTPDEIMYNSILDGCAKQHRVEEALRVLDEMKNSGVGPSNYTLSILVKLLGHARRLNQAFRMVEDLSCQNGFRPNVQVYTCLVQACVLNRRLERALALHDTMVADTGCTTDEKFYAVLARGCLQLHQPLKAVEVVRAAYHLPGHSLASPARRDTPPVGVDARALEEVTSRLQAGGREEQDALAALTADLLEQRGVRLGDGQASREPRQRRRGGRTGGGGGPR
mmetsp:Transcript_102229/g.284765  ORF Transcript_102229/g.284765 Transcript_102229/m.284765 type:complete len:1078 (+) Transcript_102229:112-3345(+)